MQNAKALWSFYNFQPATKGATSGINSNLSASNWLLKRSYKSHFPHLNAFRCPSSYITNFVRLRTPSGKKHMYFFDILEDLKAECNHYPIA